MISDRSGSLTAKDNGGGNTASCELLANLNLESRSLISLSRGWQVTLSRQHWMWQRGDFWGHKPGHAFAHATDTCIYALQQIIKPSFLHFSFQSLRWRRQSSAVPLQIYKQTCLNSDTQTPVAPSLWMSKYTQNRHVRGKKGAIERHRNGEVREKRREEMEGRRKKVAREGERDSEWERQRHCGDERDVGFVMAGILRAFFGTTCPPTLTLERHEIW